MRPLVILTNQLVYDFIIKDTIRTFQVMNFVYSALLAFVLMATLDLYGASTAHKLVFTANAFATIAVTKMFAFYPVLVDLGGYFWVSLAVYAILRGRRAAVVATTVLAMMARELTLMAVLFGIHRELRKGSRLSTIALTYLPSILSFLALREFVRRTSLLPEVPVVEGGLVSVSDLVANLAYLANPLVMLFIAYFLFTLFGGLSMDLAVRALRGRITVAGEHEWLTYLGLAIVSMVLGNVDVWRYAAFALPAVAVLYAQNTALDDWWVVAPWMGLVTVVTQQPWKTMNDPSYFRDWFPLYLPVFEVPDPPTPDFWIAWIVRMTVAAALAILMWVAFTRIDRAGRGSLHRMRAPASGDAAPI
jgi:hypothetical protein